MPKPLLTRFSQFPNLTATAHDVIANEVRQSPPVVQAPSFRYVLGSGRRKFLCGNTPLPQFKLLFPFVSSLINGDCYGSFVNDELSNNVGIILILVFI